MSLHHAHHNDSKDLAAFGYQQSLERSLGSFSSFAAGFSYLSILTGMFQTSGIGFANGGPAFIWAWIAVFFGQLMVALQFAELAGHYPLAGSVYQWSKQIAGKAWAWQTGWMYLAAQIVTIPAVALGWQVILPQISTRFQLIKCTVSTAAGSTCLDPNFPLFDDPAFAQNALILGLALVALTTLVNALGVRLMALINNVGVAVELIGAAILAVLLLWHAHRSPLTVFTDTAGTEVAHGGSYFLALLVAGYMGLYVMYGFDAAGSLAEETANPRKTAPMAVLRALVASAGMGFVILLFGSMAASDTLYGVGGAGIGLGGLTAITKDVLGATGGTIFLWMVVVAITVCCLASHAAAVRIMFAMARDNNLPGSSKLARVSGSAKVPELPAVLIGAISAVILLFNLVNPHAFTIVISCGILFMYLAYLGVNLPLLRQRLAGWPNGAHDYFRLGRSGIVTNGLAIVWGLAMTVNLAWPRADFYGPLWYQQYGVITATVGVLVAGFVVYYGYQKNRMGVLTEHRA